MESCSILFIVGFLFSGVFAAGKKIFSHYEFAMLT